SLEETLMEYHNVLTESQLPFDLLSETALDHARVEGSRLLVDRASYETVILPACTHMWAERCAMLDLFADNGGNLIIDHRLQVAKISKDNKVGLQWEPKRFAAVEGPRSKRFTDELAASRVIK